MEIVPSPKAKWKKKLERLSLLQKEQVDQNQITEEVVLSQHLKIWKIRVIKNPEIIIHNLVPNQKM